MKKLLYINDYSCSLKDLQTYENNPQMPVSHFWGIFEIYKTKSYDLRFGRVLHIRKYPYISKLWNMLKLFILNFNVDIIYCALPGFDWLFLLAKKIKLKKYKIICVVHHPSSRLIFPDQYDEVIFICKEAYNKYNLENKKYIFWGPDLKFYNINKEIENPSIDFISAGKTHRDYESMRIACNESKVRYKIIGDRNEVNNQLSYIELLKEYENSKFIIIPLEKSEATKGLLNGLTSFNDAIALGKPMIISDNSKIEVDIERLNIGYTYKAGNSEDLKNKITNLISIGHEEYAEKCKDCKQYAQTHSFDSEFGTYIKNLLLTYRT